MLKGYSSSRDPLSLDIVLFKMFSQWFFANNKIIITLRTSKVET